MIKLKNRQQFIERNNQLMKSAHPGEKERNLPKAIAIIVLHKVIRVRRDPNPLVSNKTFEKQLIN